MPEKDIEQLLQQMASEQQAQTRILQEQRDEQLKDEYLRPFRENLERAEQQARKSGSSYGITLWTKAKTELRNAEQDIQLGKHRLTETDQIAEQMEILLAALETAQLDLYDARTDFEKRPNSVEAGLRVQREIKKVARCEMDIKSFRRKNGL